MQQPINNEPLPQTMSWSTPIDRIRHLGNMHAIHEVRVLRVLLQNLETRETHAFEFADPLGFKFTVAHNMRRLGNATTVTDSPWLKEHAAQPKRTRKLEGAVHYIFCSHEGEMEVLAVAPPVHSCSSE